MALKNNLSRLAPRTYMKLRDARRSGRQWLAESPQAAALVNTVPGLMKGRNLAPSVDLAEGTEASDRLNRLAACLPSRSTYLEIGVSFGRTFDAVGVPFKWGVDPAPKFNPFLLPQGCRIANTTSDDFFARLDSGIRFDLVYLDGLHHWQQTYRDFLNGMDHALPHTVFLIDDVVPTDEFSSWPDQDAAIAGRRATGNLSSAWHGDVFKVLFAIRDCHPDLSYRVITDGWNAQAVVWSTSGYRGSRDVQRARDDSYADETFSSTFRDGSPPSWFNCVTMESALADIRRTMAALGVGATPASG